MNEVLQPSCSYRTSSEGNFAVHHAACTHSLGFVTTEQLSSFISCVIGKLTVFQQICGSKQRWCCALGCERRQCVQKGGSTCVDDGSAPLLLKPSAVIKSLPKGWVVAPARGDIDCRPSVVDDQKRVDTMTPVTSVGKLGVMMTDQPEAVPLDESVCGPALRQPPRPSAGLPAVDRQDRVPGCGTASE